MTLIDPEGNEKKNLHKLVDFSDRRVLEVGCGEGRLTRQYAAASHLTAGIDPDHTALRIARADTPNDQLSVVYFSTASAKNIPFANSVFDIVLLAWSL